MCVMYVCLYAYVHVRVTMYTCHVCAITDSFQLDTTRIKMR